MVHDHVLSRGVMCHHGFVVMCVFHVAGRSRWSEGRSEYHQRLLWRPRPQGSHCSHQSHGRAPLTARTTTSVFSKVGGLIPCVLCVPTGVSELSAHCVCAPSYCAQSGAHLSLLCLLLTVFQLQLHERGMKIHQIIYEQVTALCDTHISVCTCLLVAA